MWARLSGGGRSQVRQWVATLLQVCLVLLLLPCAVSAPRRLQTSEVVGSAMLLEGGDPCIQIVACRSRVLGEEAVPPLKVLPDERDPWADI